MFLHFLLAAASFSFIRARCPCCICIVSPGSGRRCGEAGDERKAKSEKRKEIQKSHHFDLGLEGAEKTSARRRHRVTARVVAASHPFRLNTFRYSVLRMHAILFPSFFLSFLFVCVFTTLNVYFVFRRLASPAGWRRQKGKRRKN